MKLTLFLAPLIYILVFFALYAWFPNFYLRLVIEDSFIEYAQAFLYLTASILGFVTAIQLNIARQKGKVFIVLIYAIACLLIFGEEISWAQRIFGLKTPDAILQINTQRELTFHNLTNVQPHTAIAYYFICSFLCLAWILPSALKLDKQHFLHYASPGWELVTYFAPIAFFYYFHSWYFKDVPADERYFLWAQVESWRHQETFELLFAMGLVLFISKLPNGTNRATSELN